VNVASLPAVTAAMASSNTSAHLPSSDKLGALVGEAVGLTVGLRVGDREGATVLPMKGALVGMGVGTCVGLGEG
jgi:hypothetical protein